MATYKEFGCLSAGQIATCEKLMNEGKSLAQLGKMYGLKPEIIGRAVLFRADKRAAKAAS